MYFRRKIDSYLRQWKDKENRLPLIIKGARQIGKTESIVHFASENYENIVFINFVLEGQYKTILSDGYSVENIIKNISLIDPSKKFIAGKTLIVFDELQEFPPGIILCRKNVPAMCVLISSKKLLWLILWFMSVLPMWGGSC